MKQGKEIASIELKLFEREKEKVTSEKLLGGSHDLIDLLTDAIADVLANSIKPDVDLNFALYAFSQDIRDKILEARERKEKHNA